ncbi:MAG TPA: hypothetical protein H9866_06360 [Candidatus Tidjanibacter gallistercoris]|nr:hypothetical protein [Candidatus Tidjanibacter gallistercoris]
MAAQQNRQPFPFPKNASRFRSDDHAQSGVNLPAGRRTVHAEAKGTAGQDGRHGLRTEQRGNLFLAGKFEVAYRERTVHHAYAVVKRPKEP